MSSHPPMIYCPRDREVLASNDLNNYRYFSCQRCAGSWIPGIAMDKVLSQTGLATLDGLSSFKDSPFVCPDCKNACTAILIHECELDVCRHCHGVWFDLGEVRRLKHLFPIDSGVVDAAVSADPSKIGRQSMAAELIDVILTIMTFG